MALNEGQIVTLAVDEIIETMTSLTPMAQKASKYTPPASEMQRSSNTIWMPVEQESPTQEGWDLTGKSTGLLELNVPVISAPTQRGSSHLLSVVRNCR